MENRSFRSKKWAGTGFELAMETKLFNNKKIKQ
jgi:hypothetical protein